MKTRIIFLCVVTFGVSLNAVSLREALMNSFKGKSNRQFMFEQGLVAMALSGFTTAFASLTPGGLAAYPPFVIVQLISLGFAGSASALYSRPKSMQVDFSTKAQSWASTDDLTPIQPSFSVASVQENAGPIRPSVAITGEDIIGTLVGAFLLGAVYKGYQWYAANQAKEPQDNSDDALPLVKQKLE